MRAAELIAPLTFRLTDMPIEDPGPGEVQVRVRKPNVPFPGGMSHVEVEVGSCSR